MGHEYHFQVDVLLQASALVALCWVQLRLTATGAFICLILSFKSSGLC
jgi:hypothetical protein